MLVFFPLMLAVATHTASVQEKACTFPLPITSTLLPWKRLVQLGSVLCDLPYDSTSFVICAFLCLLFMSTRLNFIFVQPKMCLFNIDYVHFLLFFTTYGWMCDWKKRNAKTIWKIPKNKEGG